MELLPNDIESKLPPLYSTEGIRPELKPVLLHYFTSSWDWYVLEYDPKEKRFFGLVDGLELEYGYFMLDELEKVITPLGMRIERDLHWQIKSLEEVHRYAINLRMWRQSNVSA